MLALMPEPQKEKIIRLQVFVPDSTRRKLKSVAAAQDLEMGELTAIGLDYLLPLIESGKAPPAIAAAIEKAKRDKAEKDDSDKS